MSELEIVIKNPRVLNSVVNGTAILSAVRKVWHISGIVQLTAPLNHPKLPSLMAIKIAAKGLWSPAKPAVRASRLTTSNVKEFFAFPKSF